MPTIRNSRQLGCAPSKRSVSTVIRTPIRKQPVRFTTSVPHGNRPLDRCVIALPTTYRAAPPNAAPSITARILDMSDSVEALQNIARRISQRDRPAVGAAHGTLRAGERGEKPVDLGGLELHVDLDGRAARDGGSDGAAHIGKRRPAQLALGDLENLEKDLLHVGCADACGRGLDGDGAVSERLGFEP